MESVVPVFEHPTRPRRHASVLQWRGWPSRLPQHRHERDAEFGFVTVGTGYYTTGERTFPLCPGRLFYIPPGLPHGSTGVDRRLHCWVLSVPRARLAALPAENTGVVGQLSPEQARRLGRMLTDLVSEPDDVAFDLGAEYLAASALSALESAMLEATTPPVHRAVEMATRLLKAEGGDGQPLTLDTLARRCGVSRSRLTALFRSEQGMSIVEFRNRERLHRCLALHAAQPDLGLTNAAFSAGFGSYSQFYRTFCDVVGCTPVEYARRAALRSAPVGALAAR
jgi:AraC-like DNA-binding protein/quercetin dioxygenase-like cupin family protein